MQIALIGCGAIGTALLELVKDDAGLQVAAIVVPGEGADAARAVAQRLAPQAVVVQAVPADGIDLVVEAAGHAAIEQHVLPALRRGVPCIVASVGALSAEGLLEQLEAAARSGGTQAQLIAGAIGAKNGISAAFIKLNIDVVYGGMVAIADREVLYKNGHDSDRPPKQTPHPRQQNSSHHQSYGEAA